MIMDAMRMNQGNACECSIVDEELIERFWRTIMVWFHKS
jgi:hypothetical protein